MVGNNNPYTTENTRKQGKTTVGEERKGRRVGKGGGEMAQVRTKATAWSCS